MMLTISEGIVKLVLVTDCNSANNYYSNVLMFIRISFSEIGTNNNNITGIIKEVR